MRRRKVRWTPDMDEYLTKKRREGASYERIACHLDIARSSAQRRFKLLCPNAPSTYMPRRRVHDLALRETVVKMKQAGLKQREIAKKLGLRVNQVHGIWWHWRSYEAPRRGAA